MEIYLSWLTALEVGGGPANRNQVINIVAKLAHLEFLTQGPVVPMTKLEGRHIKAP